MKISNCDFELGQTVYFIDDFCLSKKYVTDYYIACRVFAIHLTEAEKRSHITLKSDSWLPSLSKSVPLYKVDKWVFKTENAAKQRLLELKEQKEPFNNSHSFNTFGGMSTRQACELAQNLSKVARETTGVF